MRQVRFVRQGDEADHVVLETLDGQEQFVLLVDSAMRDAARADLPRLNVGAPPPARISPREIQTRVRAGESPEALAAENDMTLERVMRFAGPVLQERARVTAEARNARARLDGEGLPVPFGETVDGRFAAHGIDPAAVRWDARRGEDGQWIVTATWPADDGQGGAADRDASWSFALGARQVSAIDDTAGDLLSGRPIRPIVPIRPVEQARPVATIVVPSTPGVVAFPARPQADTGKLPVIEPQELQEPQLFDQEALTPAPAVSDDVDDERAEKARIPSWDDILLGVRRKSD